LCERTIVNSLTFTQLPQKPNENNLIKQSTNVVHFTVDHLQIPHDERQWKTRIFLIA